MKKLIFILLFVTKMTMMVLCGPLDSRIFSVDMVQEPTIERDTLTVGFKAFFDIKNFKEIFSRSANLIIPSTSLSSDTQRISVQDSSSSAEVSIGKATSSDNLASSTEMSVTVNEHDTSTENSHQTEHDTATVVHTTTEMTTITHQDTTELSTEAVIETTMTTVTESETTPSTMETTPSTVETTSAPELTTLLETTKTEITATTVPDSPVTDQVHSTTIEHVTIADSQPTTVQEVSSTMETTRTNPPETTTAVTTPEPIQTTAMTEATTTKSTSNTDPDSAEKPSEDEIAKWDKYLAAQMMFGDPKSYWPGDALEVKRFCAEQKENSLDDHLKFYYGLYKDNKLAQKVARIFAEDGVNWVQKFCSPINTRNSNIIVKRGMSAGMAARESKTHRDVLVENLMKAIQSPKKFKPENFICILTQWAERTEGIYPDDDEVKDLAREYLTKTFNKIAALFESEAKIKKSYQCEFVLVGKPDKNPPKSVQLLVLDAINAVTKAHGKAR